MNRMTDSEPTYLLVRTTLAAAIAIGLASFAAATWLAGSSLDTGSLARLASAQADHGDPVTTGSLGRHAASLRIDPCALPVR